MKYTRLSRLAPVAAALVALVTHPAQAADSVLLSSTMTLSNLTYQLIDLDPTDGITPWIKFSTGGFVSVGSTDTDVYFTSTSGLNPSQAYQVSSPNGANIATAGPSQFQASSTIRTSDLPALNTTNVYYQPDVYGQSRVAAYGAINPDTGEQLPTVTLSANTLLIIKGSASLQETMNLAPLQATLAASGADYLNISSQMSTTLDAALISSTLTSSGSTATGSTVNLATPGNYVSGRLSVIPQEGDLSLTSSFDSGLTPFKMTLTNTEQTSMDADLNVHLGANTSLNVTAVYPYTPPPQPAVPEPSTYLLTGLGLAAAGAVARKRSSVSR